jgi:hypothetical protein
MYSKFIFVGNGPKPRWAAVSIALLSLGMLIAAPRNDVAAGTNKVEDGSFEAGRNAGIWIEKSTNFGTPICSFAACGDGAGTANARTGSFWAWFGGASTFEERGSLTQNVKFPSGGSAKLRFYLWIGDSSPDGKDYLKVLVDGQKVFSAKESSTKYDSYTLVLKDVSQFADGQKHKVQFKNKCTGDANSNFSVDDVSITAD